MHMGINVQEVFEEVQLVGCQIQEAPTPGDLRDHPPGKRVGIGLVRVGWCRQYDADIAHIADGPSIQQLLGLEEAG